VQAARAGVLETPQRAVPSQARFNSYANELFGAEIEVERHGELLLLVVAGRRTAEVVDSPDIALLSEARRAKMKRLE
jgi:hypothetical protein